jgi:hypothetical protein
MPKQMDTLTMTRHSVSSTGPSASKSLHWEQNDGEHIVVCVMVWESEARAAEEERRRVRRGRGT